MCLGAWEPHGSSWFNCTRYDDKDAEGVRKKVDRSRALLKRYLFYYNRFKSHESSRKAEGNLWKAVDRRMRKMQDAGWGWVEVQVSCAWGLRESVSECESG